VDRIAAARSLYTALSAIEILRVALSPYLPFSSQQLQGYLHGETGPRETGWGSKRLVPGQPLVEPKPLFRKLDAGDLPSEEERPVT